MKSQNIWENTEKNTDKENKNSKKDILEIISPRNHIFNIISQNT